MFDPKEVATFCAGLVIVMVLVVLFVWGNYKALAERYDRIREKYEDLEKQNRYLGGRLTSEERQPRRFAIFIQKNPDERAAPERISPEQARAMLDSASARANGHAGAGASVPGGEKPAAKLARAEGPAVHMFGSTSGHTAPGGVPHAQVPKRADRG